MSAFFDTNILVYAQQNGAKADKARALLAAGGALSVQVLNEFAAVSRRKLGEEWDEIGEAIEDALALVDPPLSLTMTLHGTAREIARDHDFSFYDALIVAAALDAGCDSLLSDDLQDGRAFGALRPDLFGSTWTQLPDWIGAHVRMFELWGAAPRLLVPDNIKSGVHKAYGAVAAHYRVGIRPIDIDCR